MMVRERQRIVDNDGRACVAVGDEHCSGGE